MLHKSLEEPSYTVKLTTEGGTAYTYDAITAASPSDAGSIVCMNWAGPLSCPCAHLRQTTEHQWESTSPEGVLVQVRREVPAETGSMKEPRKHYRITFRYEDGTRATHYTIAFMECEFIKSDWERTPTGYRDAAGASITVEDLGP